MFAVVVEWLNELAQSSPSLVFAWSSLAATAVATVCCFGVLLYLVWYRKYTAAIEYVGISLALFSSVAYSLYYGLLIADLIPSSISAIVLRPVNSLLFGSIIIMAGAVVQNNKMTRQLIELNARFKQVLGKA